MPVDLPGRLRRFGSSPATGAWCHRISPSPVRISLPWRRARSTRPIPGTARPSHGMPTAWRRRSNRGIRWFFWKHRDREVRRGAAGRAGRSTGVPGGVHRPGRYESRRSAVARGGCGDRARLHPDCARKSAGQTTSETRAAQSSGIAKREVRRAKRKGSLLALRTSLLPGLGFQLSSNGRTTLVPHDLQLEAVAGIVAAEDAKQAHRP